MSQLSSRPICTNLTQLIDSLLSACRALAETDFAEPPFPRPYASLAELDAVPFTLPSVLVPPEAIEGLTTEIEEDAPVKKEEWPEFFIRLFDNEVRSASTALLATFMFS